MSKKSPLSITNLWILSGIIVLAAAGFYWKFVAQKSASAGAKPSGQNLFYRDLTALAKSLEQRWKEGDIDALYETGKFSCPELIPNGQPVHTSYFQCNPFYLLCHLKGQAGLAPPENFELQHHAFVKRGSLSLKFKHKLSGRHAFLTFADTCDRALLPESVYSAGPREGSLYLWDNYGQKIYLDTRYVTNLDIFVWLDSAEKKTNFNLSDLHRPSLGLSLEERKRFCEHKGGQLLQSRYFDAATFLPSKVKNDYVYKFPYPWTKRKDPVWEGKKDCQKLFTKECADQGYVYHGTYSPSWSGIYHSLGSFEEIFVNKFYPPANVKISSQALALSSPWHRLGFRGSEDKTASLAGYNGQVIEQPLESGGRAFRCVYYR